MQTSNHTAVTVVKDLLTDYVNLLQKDHPTAARFVQANANAALNQLMIAQSDTKVPDENSPERVPRPGAEA